MTLAGMFHVNQKTKQKSSLVFLTDNDIQQKGNTLSASLEAQQKPVRCIQCVPAA